MAKTTNSGFFINGVHVLTPFDGSVNHGHQFRGVAPEPAEEIPAETAPVEVKPVKKTRAKKTV